MFKLIEKDKQQMFDDARNLWLSALFYNISTYYPDISFEQQKEVFFRLVKEALEHQIIKFDYPPLEQYAGKEGFWDADNTTVMQYLKDGFPKHATSELDEDVNLYFYLVAPPANWL